MPEREHSGPRQVTLGVLALQGAFHEHIVHLTRCLASSQTVSVHAIAVRTPEQLQSCHGLVIPGGESTAIALGAVRGGLLEPLRQWVRDGKPVWGTCAGMIMLAREATGGKKMQELIGGWDGRVSRNGWGSQVDSFEAPLDIPVLSGEDPFPGVFIRAPVVERLLPADDVVAAEPGQPASAGRQPGEELSNVNLLQYPVKGAEINTPATPSIEDPFAKEGGLLAAATATASKTTTLRLAVAPPLRRSSPYPPVEVIARLTPEVRPPPELAPGPDADVVALRQANVFVTSFHPELTKDTRLHRWWVEECVVRQQQQQQQAARKA